MHFLRYITALIILLTLSSPVTANQSQGICQEMALSLLNDSDTSIPEFKQQIMYFADMCMPESAISQQAQIFRKLELIKDDESALTIQARL